MIQKALVIDSAGIITLPSGIIFVYTYTRLFTKKSPLIGLGIRVLCTVEGSFNHNRLVAVERQPFLIIYVGKEDGRTLCNSWKWRYMEEIA